MKAFFVFVVAWLILAAIMAGAAWLVSLMGLSFLAVWIGGEVVLTISLLIEMLEA